MGQNDLQKKNEISDSGLWNIFKTYCNQELKNDSEFQNIMMFMSMFQFFMSHAKDGKDLEDLKQMIVGNKKDHD